MKVWELSKKILGIGLVCLPLTMSTSLTGCLTDDDDDKAKIDSPAVSTPLSAEKTLAVGAQGASAGSVMDLDASTPVLTSEQANSAQDAIDLVFLFYTGKFYIHNAVGARAAGVANQINLTDDYDVSKIKDIDMVKVTTKPKDQEAAKAALAAGTNIDVSEIVTGDMFIVKTTGGKIALVTVGPIVGTDNKANGEFKVSINTIP